MRERGKGVANTEIQIEQTGLGPPPRRKLFCLEDDPDAMDALR